MQLNNGSQYFLSLECFIVLLFINTSGLENVDEARMELFCHGNKTMEKIPPTKAALLQHSKRAAYQAGIWTTSELTNRTGLVQTVGAGFETTKSCLGLMFGQLYPLLAKLGLN